MKLRTAGKAVAAGVLTGVAAFGFLEAIGDEPEVETRVTHPRDTGRIAVNGAELYPVAEVTILNSRAEDGATDQAAIIIQSLIFAAAGAGVTLGISSVRNTAVETQSPLTTQ